MKSRRKSSKKPFFNAVARSFQRDRTLLHDYAFSSIVGGAAAWGISMVVPQEPDAWARRHAAALISTAGLFASTVYFVVRRGLR